MKRSHLCGQLARFTSFVSFLILIPFLSRAQGTSPSAGTPSDKDVLVFTNGETLIGKLQRSTGDTVVFKSDMAGNITVTWSKIKELRTAGHFAVVEKGVKLRTNEADGNIPVGTISVADGNVLVSEEERQRPPLKLPLSNTADLIDQTTFSKVVLSRPAWYQNWRGAATLGLSLVQATQRSQTYTSSANFVRDIPGENWMDPETRTTINFTSSYGQLTQPNTPQIKTSIFHALAERDNYFSPHTFAFVSAQFDHDYSQGLDLQQIFSAGIGWSAIKTKNEQLDLRTALGYERQAFFEATQNQRLVSSIFSEAYTHVFEKATFHQDLSITPSWSNPNAYSATGDISLTVPIIKRISFTIGAIDTFLNNPSPNFRKNSFQFTSGITYSIR